MENSEISINSNVERVIFKTAVVEKNISTHKGSLLATAEPIVPLSPSQLDYVNEQFNSYVAQEIKNFPASANAGPTGGKDSRGDRRRNVSSLPEAKLEDLPLSSSETAVPFINKTQLGDIVVKFGNIHISSKFVYAAVELRYTGPAEVTLDLAIDFIEKFYAPAFHCGQRLRRCVSRGQNDAIIDLLSRGCDVNTADGQGLTSLHYACEYGQHDAIRTLFEVAKPTIMINARDKYGWTPLMTAAHHGVLKCVEVLLQNNADISITNELGKNALHIAAAQGRSAICNLLVNGSVLGSVGVAGMKRGSMKSGGGVQSSNEKGSTKDLTNSTLLLAKDKYHRTPLHDAAFHGHIAVFNVLKSMNGDPDCKDRFGFSAAAYAADEESRLSLPVPP